MNENAPTGRGPGRLLRSGALALLAALLAVVASVVAPATASAAGYYGGSSGYYDGGYNDGGYNGGYNDGSYSGGSTGYTGQVVVTPVLNCVQAGSNGSYTAVLGYRNTSSSTYTITGDYNVISPSSYNGRQPTVFKPGTYSGVFSVPVSYGTLYWTLGTTKLTISRTSTPACPAGTQLPADGNGTGVVGALAVAAGLGALMVRRARRRASALTSDRETVDA